MTDGIETDVKALQTLNAPLPIVVTDEGVSIELLLPGQAKSVSTFLS